MPDSEDSRGQTRQHAGGQNRGGGSLKHGDLLCIRDQAGCISHVNGPLRELADKTGAAFLGLRCDHDGRRSPGVLFGCPLLAASGMRPEQGMDGDLLIDGRRYEESLHRLYDAAGGEQGVVHVFRDVKEAGERRDREALRKSMAHVSALASEIAHEINNPLDYISNYLYLLSEAMPPDSKNREYAGGIQAGVDRLARIMRELVEYAQPLKEPFVLLRPSALLAAVLEEARTKIEQKRVDVHTHCDCGGARIAGSDRLLRKALSHVVDNALDALHSGGRLLASASCQGDSVTVEVTDSGEGIPEDVLPRIFDPFFTTKKNAPKRGVGLSLAISRNIVAMHGGSISAVSSPGKGATLRIVLPLAGEDNEKS